VRLVVTQKAWFLAVLFIVSVSALAQSPAPAVSPQLTPAPASGGQTTGEKPKGKASTTRRRGHRKPPIDDYVPCLFDEDEEYDLRARDNPTPARELDAPVNEEEAKSIADQVRSIAQSGAAKADREATALNLTITTLAKRQGEETISDQQLLLLSRQKALLSEVNKTKSAFKELAQLVDFNTFISLRPDEVEKHLDDLSSVAGITDPLATKEIVQSGNKVLGFSAIERPEDVGCSFSVLDWKETSDIFGRRVANDYIAIQVNVRNLAENNEFLIHDIQVAVDTGLNMEQFGRFQVGRDKLMVRAVAERGKSEDRRNLIINTLQMIGGISAGASAALTQAVSGETQHLGDVDTANKLSTAVEIFQGAFIPGLINIFPDHTLEHINHISDLAFSASSTLKTVVPRQGSVPLTTFLAEKPLEQLPFSRCGSLIERVTAGDLLSDMLDTSYKRQANNHSMDLTPGSPYYPFCQLDWDDSIPYGPLAFTKALHYKKWKPAALRILQRRMFVVVAGVHIQEIKNNARIDNVKCPTVLGGSIDLSAVDKDGNIACTLLGNRLDRVASVKLGQDDKAVQFKAASDGSSGALTFKANDFTGVSGSLALVLKDTAGKETDSGQSLTFSVRVPKIDQVVYKEKSANPDDNLQAILYGTNLDRIDSVTLTDSSKPDAKTYQGTIQDKDKINSVTNPITVVFDVKPKSVQKPAHVNFTTKDDVKKDGSQAKPQPVTDKDTILSPDKATAKKPSQPQSTKKKTASQAASPGGAAAGTAPSPTPSPTPRN